MPNIIEQQDLLKGLTDQRLALLMKQPTGDIPPFLVAAEAQRRQAVRQQFAGQGSKESVVDTLTKQLANFPENVQAPPQTPPQMPQGIAAIPQDQGMADGGVVQRFFKGGGVPSSTPTWDTGIIPKVYDYVTSGVNPFLENMRKFGINPTPDKQQELQDQSAAQEAAIPDVSKFNISAPPDAKITKGKYPFPEKPVEPRNPDTGKTGTSPENKYKAEEAALRDRMEKLYADQDTTGWEDAQKWFAMSAQFLDPNKTTLQSLAAAGAEFAGAESAQAQAERDRARQREEALLNWDYQSYSDRRAAEAAAAAKADERAYEIQKRGTPTADAALRVYEDAIASIDKQLEDPMQMLDDAKKQALIEQRRGYEIQRANILKAGGFGPVSGVVTNADIYGQ